MKKLLAVLMTAVLCMSLLAACGNAAKEEASAPEASDAETEAGGEEAPAVNAEEPDSAAETEALADGVLTVGTNAEFPPFEYVGDNGEPDGFDIALIKAIGEKLGVEVQVENMEFDSLVASIGRKTDVAIAGMTITEERQESVDFSNPYYMAVQYVILPEGSEIASAKDLEGKAIGVQLGTTGDFIAEEISGANVSQYNKALDAVNDLINGRLDCVIVDKNPALVFESRFEGQVKALDGDVFGFEPEEYAIALPKGDTVLADKINGALQEMMEDGTFDALVAEYIEEN
ncbi:MAG: basic amino acid ABC transporter substrate-binding protein [Lachnospiraceae bacterium]|jgi:polar amino acid transport system substrate-binding protein|nr:basic amino acid ABC transporter substrate-binding protein [Lachnospiraceae bacterium]